MRVAELRVAVVVHVAEPGVAVVVRMAELRVAVVVRVADLRVAVVVRVAGQRDGRSHVAHGGRVHLKQRGAGSVDAEAPRGVVQVHRVVARGAVQLDLASFLPAVLRPYGEVRKRDRSRERRPRERRVPPVALAPGVVVRQVDGSLAAAGVCGAGSEHLECRGDRENGVGVVVSAEDDLDSGAKAGVEHHVLFVPANPPRDVGRVRPGTAHHVAGRVDGHDVELDRRHLGLGVAELDLEYADRAPVDRLSLDLAPGSTPCENRHRLPPVLMRRNIDPALCRAMLSRCLSGPACGRGRRSTGAL